MKHFIILSVFVMLSLTGSAQLGRGAITFGTGIAGYKISGLSQSATLNSQQTRIGYAVSNSAVVGLCLETGILGNKAMPYGLTAFGRFYSGPAEHRVLRLFVEAGAGITDYRAERSPEAAMQRPDNWIKPVVSLSPGVNVFLGKAVALELAGDYRYVAGQGTAVNRFGVSGGVRFFISEASFKQIFPHTFRRPF